MFGGLQEKIHAFGGSKVQGFSPVAGLKNGQFDRERNFLVLYENCGGRI
jgi:hypothetical protein